jgi:Ca2+-transporting ATPase
VGNVFACRSERLSAFARLGTGNPLLRIALAVEVAIILAVVFLPPLQPIFGTLPPSPGILLATAVMAPIVLLALDEARKWLARSAARVSTGSA